MSHSSPLYRDAEKLTYDFTLRCGVLIMPTGRDANKSEAIFLFQKIDPKVETVQVFSGDLPDKTYRKFGLFWLTV